MSIKTRTIAGVPVATIAPLKSGRLVTTELGSVEHFTTPKHAVEVRDDDRGLKISVRPRRVPSPETPNG